MYENTMGFFCHNNVGQKDSNIDYSLLEKPNIVSSL